MINELTLKFMLKQKIDVYNADQKSLYVNNYLFRVTLVIVIILFILLIVFLFVLPILTPLFLKKGIIADVLSLSCSGCLASMVVVGSIVYFAQSKLKKRFIKKKDDDINLDTTVSLDDLLSDKDPVEFHQPTKKKTHILSRHLKLFSFIQELFSFVFSILFSPIVKPEYLYLDKSKLDFAVFLVETLVKQKHHALNVCEIQKSYGDYSNTWLANTLKVLVKIQTINICDLETGEKVVLLNLDFYNPNAIVEEDI